MIGPICSALAFASALAVARKAPQHGPIAAALGASLSYSICAVLNASLPPERQNPRALLFLLACVAVLSGWAYLKAWSWDARAALFLLTLIAVLVTGGLVWPARNWALATWGPILASVIVGAFAMVRWRALWKRSYPYERRTCPDLEMSITRRIALVLLAADVAGLLFMRWPGVVEWQGRAAAIAVTVLHVGWLIQERTVADGRRL